jgi:hypothetical protein
VDAAAKALGTGIRLLLRLRELVRSDKDGHGLPEVLIHG